MNVTVIGGGVIGLCSAYYLHKKGCRVTVLNDTKIGIGASNGNMGFVCRSHFEPAANPHKLAQGLLMMFKSNSPFYIRPAPDTDLLRWLTRFFSACRTKNLYPRMTSLKTLNNLSVDEYFEIEKDFSNTFTIYQKGLLLLTAKETEMKHLANEHELFKEFQVQSQILDAKDFTSVDPHLHTKAIGGLYFPNDCHIDPAEFISTMKTYLVNAGVNIMENTPVKSFEERNNKIEAVITPNETLRSDSFVMAAGSWSGNLLKKLRRKICMVPAKGYSIKLPVKKNSFTTPFIIAEKMIAASQFGNSVRFGSTMEIGKQNGIIHAKRTQNILSGIREFLPDYHLENHQSTEFWCGYRPFSHDGLPYIGADKSVSNLFLATGHGILGMMQGPGTGKLVSELVTHQDPSIDLEMFNPDR